MNYSTIMFTLSKIMTKKRNSKKIWTYCWPWPKYLKLHRGAWSWTKSSFGLICTWQERLTYTVHVLLGRRSHGLADRNNRHRLRSRPRFLIYIFFIYDLLKMNGVFTWNCIAAHWRTDEQSSWHGKYDIPINVYDWNMMDLDLWARCHGNLFIIRFNN